MEELKSFNVSGIGLTKEELELAKVNPEAFSNYINYKRDLLKLIDAERLAHEKEIELQRIEAEKSKIEHEKTYNMLESRANCIMSIICNSTYSLNNSLNSRNKQQLSDEQIEIENYLKSVNFDRELTKEKRFGPNGEYSPFILEGFYPDEKEAEKILNNIDSDLYIAGNSNGGIEISRKSFWN